ncbi:hypothetical protein [Mucilaginibacter gossypii]|uniref:Uncharacterized protein n=1 Tax=Mucilaginibacter gossypii TaxID=551996 RepID=A0A1G8BAH6_9SPHI|nr:hypothetical protein [Mucilaginibacter gossypii]SDH30239.1 hypothetical protein SAMN05192573_108195 [Mucilaginibacter gossypii]
MKNSSLLNKDLAVPEDQFVRSITNDFTGNGFVDHLEWAMLTIQQNFKQMFLERHLPPITRSHFDRAYLMAGGADSLNDTVRFFTPFTDLQATPEIFPDLNIKVMTLNDSIQLNKVKQIDLRTKNILKSKLQYAYEMSTAFYNKDTEAFYGFREGYEMNKGFFNLEKKLENLDKLNFTELPNPISLHPNYMIPKNAITLLPKSQVQDVMKIIAMSYQVAFSMYYEWCIYIKEYDNIGLILPIEPAILSEIYKTSLMKFDSRRQMVHFVKEHYRRKAASPNEDYSVFVNRYLRGEHRFDCRGFYAEVIPPKYDLLRAKTRKKFADGLK